MRANQDDFAIAEIRITYEGKALESHSIDAELFAKSISAASQILKETSRTIYGYEFKVELKITNVEHNCISADFYVIMSRAADAIQFLIDHPLSIFLKKLMELAGIYAPLITPVAWSIVKLYKWLKNRRIKKTELHKDTVTITLEDGSQETISLELYDLLCNKELNKQLKKHTRILLSDGIDKMTYYQKNNDEFVETSTFTKEDALIYDIDLEEELSDRELDIVAELDRPSFHKAKTGWKIVQEGKVLPVPVTITDNYFLADVADGHINVSKGRKFNIHLLEQYSKQGKPKYKAISINTYP